MSPARDVWPDAQAAAEACARRVVELLNAALTEAPHATFAISGGSSPKPMFDNLARSGVPWDRIHLFWVTSVACPRRMTPAITKWRMSI